MSDIININVGTNIKVKSFSNYHLHVVDGMLNDWIDKNHDKLGFKVLNIFGYHTNSVRNPEHVKCVMYIE